MNRDELVNRLTNIAEKDPVKAVRLFEVIEMLCKLSDEGFSQSAHLCKRPDIV